MPTAVIPKSIPSRRSTISSLTSMTSSITPQEPKIGHWIKKDGYSDCSECGSHIVTEWDYCPKCGAKMIKSQESKVNNG